MLFQLNSSSWFTKKKKNQWHLHCDYGRFAVYFFVCLTQSQCGLLLEIIEEEKFIHKASNGVFHWWNLKPPQQENNEIKINEFMQNVEINFLSFT